MPRYLKRETSAAERLTLSDAEILDVMGKMIKQRQESLDIYEKAGRTELAAQEREEIEIIAGVSAQAIVGHRSRRGDLRADQGT